MKVVCLALGLLLGACDMSGPGEPDKQVQQILTACPGFNEIGKPPVVQGAECGSLTVRENPDNENSAKISLNILRLPAINPTPKPDPLFIVAGGPGQSAVNTAETLHFLFNDIRKNRDIVFVDQRGTGQSNPLSCSELEGIQESLTPDQMPPVVQDPLIPDDKPLKLQQAVADCVARYGEHLQFYTTPYAVQDLDAVRQALGYPEINLWSVSYGTRVALAYAQRFPDVTRSSILDGVAPVAISLPWFAGADAQASLMQLSEQCLAEESCKKRYGNIMEKAQAISHRLATAPLELQLEHPRTQLPMTIHLDQQTFVSVVRMALYMRDLSTLVPLMVASAYDGDYQSLGTLISMVEEQAELMDISFGMHYTVLCNEDYPQYQARDFAQSPLFLGVNLAASVRNVCASWPHYPINEDYFSLENSAIPTLLLSGARDPITPPHWAERVMKNLSHATHLIAPGGHHSISRDGCVSQIITLFVQQDSAANLDMDCVADIQPLAPYLDVFNEAAMTTPVQENQ